MSDVTGQAERHRTRLVLLGTAGGPVWYGHREGIGSAVAVNGEVYLVDCGEGVAQQYLRANFAPFEGRRTLRGLRIAKEAGLDEATTSRVVGALEKLGHLDRGPTVDDKRAWRVIVTDKGRRLLKTATPLAERAAKRFAAEQD